MECLHPIKLYDQGITVRCGKCYTCLKHAALEWSIRLVEESKSSVHNSFCSLTYADDCPDFDGNLHSLHLQKYVDNFQHYAKNRLGYKKSPKFFACGEYGSKTFRPHYHIIWFNVDVSTIREYNERYWEKRYGLSNNRPLLDGGCAYVAKYAVKATTDWAKDHHRTLPFRLMSRGLGMNFVRQNKLDFLESVRRDRRPPGYKFPGGYEVPLPRYFRQKIYGENGAKYVGLLHSRKHLTDELKSLKDFEESPRAHHYTYLDFKKMRAEGAITKSRGKDRLYGEQYYESKKEALKRAKKVEYSYTSKHYYDWQQKFPIMSGPKVRYNEDGSYETLNGVIYARLQEFDEYLKQVKSDENRKALIANDNQQYYYKCKRELYMLNAEIEAYEKYKVFYRPWWYDEENDCYVKNPPPFDPANPPFGTNNCPV